MARAQASGTRPVAVAAAASRNRCAFHETQLRVGDALYIEIPRMLDKRRDTVTLVGWMEGHCLIVSAPKDDLLRKELAAGEDVLLRTFSGRAAYAFRTTVISPVRAPVHHLYLNYPESVECVTIRTAARCRFELPTRMTMGEAEIRCSLRNLSAEGALLETDTTLHPGDLVDRITLGFELHDVPVELQVKAAVRSVKPDPASGARQYGLEFLELKSTEKLALVAFVTHQILANRANAT